MKRAVFFCMVGLVAMVGAGTIQANEASFRTFVEDNDLWKEDSLDKKSGITEAKFNEIIDAAHTIYDDVGGTLTINRNWEDATVNASCSKFFGMVTINMYGGLARREEITPEGFALVLCHEIGHAYGGLPYINAFLELSAEGQADYYGASACLEQVLPLLRDDDGTMTDGFVEERCSEAYADRDQYELCLQRSDGAYSLGLLLAAIKEEPVPEFDTPDPTVVNETMTSYPDTIQCRLDTYFNGILGLDRPKCWFAD